MPRYDYLCPDCQEVRELVFTMAEKPAVVACSCGGLSTSVIRSEIDVLVKGGSRPFKLDASCVPIGWERGNTDVAKQEARYSKMIAASRREATANKRKAIRGGIQHIGSVPLELDRMRRNQYGRDYWQDNPREKLKADGLLFE